MRIRRDTQWGTLPSPQKETSHLLAVTPRFPQSPPPPAPRKPPLHFPGPGLPVPEMSRRQDRAHVASRDRLLSPGIPSARFTGSRRVGAPRSFLLLSPSPPRGQTALHLPVVGRWTSGSVSSLGGFCFAGCRDDAAVNTRPPTRFCADVFSLPWGLPTYRRSRGVTCRSVSHSLGTRRTGFRGSRAVAADGVREISFLRVRAFRSRPSRRRGRVRRRACSRLTTLATFSCA